MEAAPHPWPALGALLLRDGALTVEQLEAALREKETSSKRLGEILVDSGFVTPTQISRVLAEQHELPFIDLTREAVDPGAAGLLPESVARRYGAIPVAFQADGSVLVAVSDPTDVVAADDLRFTLGAAVRVGVASPSRSRTRSPASTAASRPPRTRTRTSPSSSTRSAQRSSTYARPATSLRRSRR